MPKPLLRIQAVAPHSIFLVIMYVSLKLRTHAINRGFWEDECFEYTMSAARPILGALSFQPFPVYHLSAYFSLFLGNEEWAIRVPSIFFGLAGIALIYYLVFKHLGGVWALIAAFWLAINPFHIYSSSEARFYALTVLAVLLIVLTLQNALKLNRKRDWFYFVLAGNFGALSQATVLPFLFSFGIGSSAWLLLEYRNGHIDQFNSRFLKMLAYFICALAGSILCNIFGDYGLLRNFSSKENQLNEVLIEGSSQYEIIHYKLSLSEYLSYFSVYFENINTPTGVGLFLLATLGIYFFGKQRSPLACILVAPFVFAPLPFFFITTTHWYHARYFCPLIPLAIILIISGLVQITVGIESILSKWRKTSATTLQQNLVRFLVIFIFISCLSSSTIHSFTNSENRAYAIHLKRDHKIGVNLIRQHAQPYDMAITQYRRPSWYFYQRKVLLPYFVEHVERNKPFTLFFWTNQGNADINYVPAGAKRLDSINEDSLNGNGILRFEISPQRLREIPELGTLSFEDTELDSDFKVDIKSDGSTIISLLKDKTSFQLTSKRIKAMPHRYIEWIAELEGPPQYGLLMNFFDENNVLLATESVWMRETGTSRAYEYAGIYGEDERVIAQRETHPTGAGPPLLPTDQAYKLKLSCVTPPCTNYIETQLLLRGDTRAGDQYQIINNVVLGNWSENEFFIEKDISLTSDNDTSFNGWEMENDHPGSSSELIISDGPEGKILTFSALTDKSSFKVFSDLYSAIGSNTLKLEFYFRGDISHLTPIFEFTDGETSELEWRVLYAALPQAFRPRRPSMVITPTDTEWIKVYATIWVPENKSEFRFGFLCSPDPNTIAQSQSIDIRSLKFYVEGDEGV